MSKDELEKCPVCAEPLKADDICATDIEMGICHAACLDGSPVVDLDTGEEIEGGKVDTFRYGDEAYDDSELVRLRVEVRAKETEALGYLRTVGSLQEELANFRAASPVAYLREGSSEQIQGVPLGAMWITDEADPKGFPVYTFSFPCEAFARASRPSAPALKMLAPQVHNKHRRTAPADAVYIGRGSPYGNPFVIGRDGDRDEVCERFRCEILPDLDVSELAGKDLVCFCAPKRCHGDDLLRKANSTPPPPAQMVGPDRQTILRVAKALALDMYPDARWPVDELDANRGVLDREGRSPLSWHFANKCMSQACVAIIALSAPEAEG